MTNLQHDLAENNSTYGPHSYKQAYQHSIKNPEEFWRDKAKILDWYKFPEQIKDCSYNTDDFRIKWYADGELNASVNCVDRHLSTHGNETAIIWEGDEPGNVKKFTYSELYDQVCHWANVLKNQGVVKGDRVTIYLPMIPQAVFAMLACARIGAIHSVVFGGFSPESLSGRIIDSQSKVLITADAGRRGGRTVPLKDNVDKALEADAVKTIKSVIVVKHTEKNIKMQQGRDFYYDDLSKTVAAECAPESMSAEDPLFILYTSGSTGKPKGVLHTTGGYMVYASFTHSVVFDYNPGEIYWCTADVGWITGHSYGVYGPLANRATIVLFEGVPTYPNASRFWQIVEDHSVNIFYTAPTAIRGLMKAGEEPVKKHNLLSLRVLGTVGEPINPDAWDWYRNVVGGGSCPIMDTWWQTETGGIMMSPLVGVNSELKPGSCMQPFFGIEPTLLDKDGQEVTGEASGALTIKHSWPGQMRGVYGDEKRFVDTYFKDFEGYYFSGDGARRDADGHFWLTGRMDDVINVSGHRMGTAEIEAALDAHDKVVESAVVGAPHDIKGEDIYAFVTLTNETQPTEELRFELIQWVSQRIGPIAKPGKIHWAPNLPKTRSGKIMRRILRRVAAKDEANIGDTSTLADPNVVDELISGRP